MATTALRSENGMGLASSRALNVGLWVAQGLLAAAFLTSAAVKLTMPVDQLAQKMPWVSGSMGGLVRFIGVAELLGAIGLILPSASRIKPGLTVLAALGLLAIMILASATHASRGEFPMLPVTMVLGGLAAFIAWGRAKKSPIAPR